MRKSKESVFDDEPPVPVIDESSPLIEGLNEEEREKFAALLNKKMSLNKRADILITLANLNDRHGAPVALRAIEQINKITRVTEDKVQDAAALFQLPPDTQVAVVVSEPKE